MNTNIIQTPSPGNTTTEKIQSALKEMGTFIYETPIWVVVVTVTGIAAAILMPPYSIPLFVVAGTLILTRLAVKIIDVYNAEFLKDLKEKLSAFQQKYFYVEYIALAITILVTVFTPIAGSVVGISLGVYKGLVVELSIIKYKQAIRREELSQPVKELIVAFNNC